MILTSDETKLIKATRKINIVYNIIRPSLPKKRRQFMILFYFRRFDVVEIGHGQAQECFSSS